MEGGINSGLAGRFLIRLTSETGSLTGNPGDLKEHQICTLLIGCSAAGLYKVQQSVPLI